MNVEWNSVNKKTLVFRWIAIPELLDRENRYLLNSIEDAIIGNLHYHLWHGIYCNIAVFNPLKVTTREMLDYMNFCAIPKQCILFDIKGFYGKSKVIRNIELEGYKYQERVERFYKIRQKASSVHQLWYTDKHFSNERLRGYHWNALRDFFWGFWGRKPLCYICGKLIPKSQFHLDHRTPLEKGGINTICNLRASHQRCNLLKLAGKPAFDPSHIPHIIDKEHFPKKLSKVFSFKEKPDWLGNIDRPLKRVKVDL